MWASQRLKLTEKMLELIQFRPQEVLELIVEDIIDILVSPAMKYITDVVKLIPQVVKVSSQKEVSESIVEESEDREESVKVGEVH